MHRRGRKLVASLRKGRESFRSLDQRLAGLEQKTQEAFAERDRLREDVTKALEQQSTQETQAAAWNAVVDATDRLSNNYRQLVAENSRLAGEIDSFTNARSELAAEKAAASEMLAMLREQHKEQQQRQAEFDLQRGQWQNELRAFEARVVVRDQWAENFERELKAIRSALDAPTVPIAEWKSLAEEVASLRGQQSETLRQRTLWESRVVDCENRLAERGQRIEAVEQSVQELRVAAQEQVSRSSDWSALSGQVASLVGQQTDREDDHGSIQKRLNDCESFNADRLQQLGNLEQQLEELRAASQVQSAQAAGWTALSDQLADLRNQQSEWEKLRSDWQGRVDGCDLQFGNLRTQLANVEQAVGELHAENDQPSISVADWTAISAQVASLRDQQSEWERLRGSLQSRVDGCDNQFVDLRKQLAEIDQAVGKLHAENDQPSISAVELTSLSEQVFSLRDQQSEWEKLRGNWQGRVDDCDTQIVDLRKQLADVEQTVSELHAEDDHPTIPIADWTATFRTSRFVAGPTGGMGKVAQQFARPRRRLRHPICRSSQTACQHRERLRRTARRNPSAADPD